MALPSQAPRVSRQASFRPRSPQRSTRIITLAAAGLAVAGAVGGWWWWQAKQPTPAQASAPAQDVVAGPASLSLGEPKGGPSSLATERRSSPAISTTLAVNEPALTPIKTGAPVIIPAGPSASVAGGPQPTTLGQGQPSTPAGGAAPVNPTAPDATLAAQSSPAESAAGQPALGSSVSPTRDPLVQRLIASGEQALARSNLVEARSFFNRALHNRRASEADAEWARQQLTDISQKLLFGPQIAANDPLVSSYIVQPGDALVRITASSNLGVDWRFIQRVNQMSRPEALRVGQKLKLVKGPFHAVVYKSAYRLDLYADATDAEGNRLYIRSFPVGLGELNSTPVGTWKVRPRSKLVNPHWVNPRTGEKFDANDPKNPIGERWLGLTGTDANTEILAGYGIHGTIEPESIGSDASMGCVRMLDDDINVIYELLVEENSKVEIVP